MPGRGLPPLLDRERGRGARGAAPRGATGVGGGVRRLVVAGRERVRRPRRPYLAGRLLGAWRLGRLGQRGLFVEPYGTVSLLDPDASIREDVLWEAAGGLHAGGFGHARLVLEVQHRSVARNAPASLGLWPGAAAPRARTRLVAQLGAAF